MSTSAVPAVIDYLVATSKASPQLGSSTTAPVVIYDGAPIDGAWPPLALYIGADSNYVLSPSTTPIPVAAVSQQSWVGLGARKRDEKLTIHCVIEAHLGDTLMKVARDAAHSVMSAFEDMTRLDANAGGNVLYTDPGVTNATWIQGQTSDGARVLISFDFSCDARIGT